MSTPNDSDPTRRPVPDDQVPPQADDLPAAPSDTDPDAADREEKPSSSWFGNLALALTVGVVLLAGLFALSGDADSADQDLLGRFQWSEPDEPATRPVRAATAVPEDDVLTLLDFSHHPDRLHQPYMEGPVFATQAARPHVPLVNQFRDLLALYQERMGIDDNFTIRVVDNRSGEVLEIFEMNEAREAYRISGEADWGVVDQKRREQTRRLVEKWVDRGIPKPAVTVKWGRATQVMEARERDRPFVEYEVRLARLLGLSLLATEVGTVETFNRDRLVSTVGARSRYQMMPYILNQNDIYHYALRTAGGQRVNVVEEWHPLLTMEPAFKLMRGYANAVGHEIPGISAYHTGPGNIYKVYRFFLQNAPESVIEGATVMDAYMWATTEGYETVSTRSSFGPYSRGYIASAYGALKAEDDLPLDTTQTMRAVRVQLRNGQSVLLGDLLGQLEELGVAPGDTSGSYYTAFRTLNPHIPLPEAAADGGVPAQGNVQLVASSGGHDVRFFLPLGSARALDRSGSNLLDPDATFRFDRDTYAYPEGGRTDADRAYDQLVDEINHFGFTRERRQRLADLAEQFETLADERPTYYRRAQEKIINTHRRIWRSAVWEQMAEVSKAVQGTSRIEGRPPEFDMSLQMPISNDMRQ